MIIVKQAEIKNQEILNFLNKNNLLDMMDIDGIRKKISNKSDISKYYVSEEYAKEMVNKGIYHDGLPEHQYLWDIRNDVDKSKELTNFLKELPLLLCGQHFSALSYYPPGGYIGWHNNANVPGYNVILTWSKTGDGHFTYINNKNEFIQIKDKPGWSVKFCYFGSYHEPEKVCYHTAYTDCDRFTIAMVFGKNKKLNKKLWEDIIYEVSHDE